MLCLAPGSPPVARVSRDRVAVRQAGPHARVQARARARWRPVGPGSQVAHAFGLLLLSADNYIHQLRTKPQRHEGTKDAQRFDAFYCFAILVGYRKQRRAAAGPRSEPLGFRLRSWPPPVGPAWAAMSSGAGRSPVGPEEQELAQPG